ncbi:hypothetical protein BLNAU_6222 [Blattamonas nauphoetae]|uniref:Uncharacterized protein n=1 Tax=Blattamonas nauphoetae TaxID=2049346 RepID=A0ABQ9Y4W8_9EUKA|nr:hypothetical protein BLNAU_6222 [Blattamonas nauphoetae]
MGKMSVQTEFQVQKIVESSVLANLHHVLALARNFVPEEPQVVHWEMYLDTILSEISDQRTKFLPALKPIYPQVEQYFMSELKVYLSETLHRGLKQLTIADIGESMKLLPKLWSIHEACVECGAGPYRFEYTYQAFFEKWYISFTETLDHLFQSLISDKNWVNRAFASLNSKSFDADQGPIQSLFLDFNQQQDMISGINIPSYFDLQMKLINSVQSTLSQLISKMISDLLKPEDYLLLHIGPNKTNSYFTHRDQRHNEAITNEHRNRVNSIFHRAKESTNEALVVFNQTIQELRSQVTEFQEYICSDIDTKSTTMKEAGFNNVIVDQYSPLYASASNLPSLEGSPDETITKRYMTIPQATQWLSDQVVKFTAAILEETEVLERLIPPSLSSRLLYYDFGDYLFEKLYFPTITDQNRLEQFHLKLKKPLEKLLNSFRDSSKAEMITVSLADHINQIFQYIVFYSPSIVSYSTKGTFYRQFRMSQASLLMQDLDTFRGYILGLPSDCRFHVEDTFSTTIDSYFKATRHALSIMMIPTDLLVADLHRSPCDYQTQLVNVGAEKGWIILAMRRKFEKDQLATQTIEKVWKAPNR